MSTVEAWQAVVQELKQLRKLDDKLMQHQNNKNGQAVQATASSMYQSKASIMLATAQLSGQGALPAGYSPSDSEFEEIVLMLKVGCE